mmetsp:Transcript_17372/g.53921  ORF Transcript_17372/g.53921 Transcript_17372/m.53921 type:complete len:181 (+) Transcript_17372:60-602(+)|eukprot:CAMPEP_0174835820 /NCGR_PEP_ID=MMETSP1114-20130205/5623_1 /TAXON_ID=312471 /ORGANISM="Neobodo designis, Strain CCAP 1951/1" /LENGTH=180 /DNA_ID=CAMNT_0016069775 /DNA_START=58 /DNA_END=600 /DNA_ORIENTATION=-
MSTPECTKLMRAVTETQYNADFNTGLAMGDVPLPEPDPAKNEVRVQVLFASTNPVDYKIARGDLAAFHKVKLPAPVGRDFSGIVHAVPEGIENPAGVKVGDRVCGFLSVTDPTKGSMAEYCTCPAKILGTDATNFIATIKRAVQPYQQATFSRRLHHAVAVAAAKGRSDTLAATLRQHLW